jgi:hypothetical protein
MSGPFATATEFCEWLGLAVPDDLARIQSLLGAASTEIRGFTNQTLSEVVGDVVTLEPIERDTLLLPERPVTAITALTVSGVAYADYRFTREGFLIQGATASTTEGTNWSYGATVTYNHGYAETTDTFGLLRSICIESALRAYAPNASGSPEVLNSIALESAGYAPVVFLTQSEKWKLMSLGPVLVG